MDSLLIESVSNIGSQGHIRHFIQTRPNGDLEVVVTRDGYQNKILFDVEKKHRARLAEFIAKV